MFAQWRSKIYTWKVVKDYLCVPDLSLYLPITLALTPDALLLSKSKTGDITYLEKIWSWATLNTSGGVIKQCTGTNQGLCACSFVDLGVIYNTGGLEGTRLTLWITAHAKGVRHTNLCGSSCQMIDAESLKACLWFCVSVCGIGCVKLGREWRGLSPSTCVLSEVLCLLK